jgi:hypothetical protein
MKILKRRLYGSNYFLRQNQNLSLATIETSKNDLRGYNLSPKKANKSTSLFEELTLAPIGDEHLPVRFQEP